MIKGRQLVVEQLFVSLEVKLKGFETTVLFGLGV